MSLPKINPNYYRNIAEEMIAKVSRIKYFTPNPWAIGSHHEAILKQAIRSFLPDRYSIKTGFVFVQEGKVSKQMDILIIDETRVNSYFLKEDELVVVHPDAVVCGIEVKTRLNKSTFKEAVENISSLKKLYTKDHSKKKNTGGLIFSFKGPNFNPELCDGWWSSIPEKDSILYPKTIFVLTQGRFDLRTDKQESWGHYFIMDEQDELKSESLAVFFALIRFYCSDIEINQEPFKYVQFTRHYSKEYYRFGIGAVKSLSD